MILCFRERSHGQVTPELDREALGLKVLDYGLDLVINNSKDNLMIGLLGNTRTVT